MRLVHSIISVFNIRQPPEVESVILVMPALYVLFCTHRYACSLGQDDLWVLCLLNNLSDIYFML